MVNFIVSISLLVFLVCQLSMSMPVSVEPSKEISTNNGAASVDPTIPKKLNSFTMPLTAQKVNYRSRGPMTRKAVYDPIKNVTHIWDIRRGSYTLVGNHVNKRRGWQPRKRLENEEDGDY